jgi:hypothetical protein
MNTYKAIQILDGMLDGDNVSMEDAVEAAMYLINSRNVYVLPGRYGRLCEQLIHMDNE